MSDIRAERFVREAAEAREQLTPELARAEIDRRKRKRAAKAAGEEFTEKAAFSAMVNLTAAELREAAGIEKPPKR